MFNKDVDDNTGNNESELENPSQKVFKESAAMTSMWEVWEGGACIRQMAVELEKHGCREHF